MAKKSKPPRRSKPAGWAPRVLGGAGQSPKPDTNAGGTWTPGTGKNAGMARTLHQRALDGGWFRPKGSS